MHKFYSLKKRQLSIKASNQGGFTLIEIMIVIAIIAIMAAYGIPAYMTKVQRSRGMETASFFKDIKEAETAYFSTHNAFYPAAAAQSDEQKIARALSLGFADSKNFAFKIQTGTDATCGDWLQIEAVPQSAKNTATGITNVTGRKTAPEKWAIAKGSTTPPQSILFQSPMPDQTETNAEAGWESGVNLGNWLDSNVTFTLGTFVDC